MENKRDTRRSFFKRPSDAAATEDQGFAPEASSDDKRPAAHRAPATRESDDERPARKPLARRPYERKPFAGADRKTYGDREDRGERRPYGDRDDREERGERRPYGDREERGERRPYDKKPYEKRSFDKKPFEKRPFNKDRFAPENEERSVPENLIFGIHPVREALEGGGNIEKIYVKRGVESAEGIVEYAHARGIQVQEVPLEKLDRLTRRGAHQGVVAVVPPIEYADFNELLERVVASDRPALFVVLDSVTDVRNFGAIARTAECAGADGLIVSAKSSAPVNAEAMKSSAGALGQIPVCRVGSLRNTLKSIQMAGVKLVAATEKTTDLLYESELTGSIALVMGAEGGGVSPELLKMCDQKVAIPMLGKIESLNVSAAAAVVLYEVVRQRFNEE